MNEPKAGVMTHTRFSRAYELREARTVTVTAIEPGVDCWHVAKQKAEQLQALSLLFEGGWSDLSMLDDSLALALFRLTSDIAGDIAGLAELGRMMCTDELDGGCHE